MAKTYNNFQRPRSGLFGILVGFIFMGMISCSAGKNPANVQSASPVKAEPEIEFFEHVVKFQGETLGRISSWYTGSTKNWMKIAEANPGLKPNRIRLGQVIRIPSTLVIQTKPLPQQSVASSGKKKSVDTSDANLQEATDQATPGELSEQAPSSAEVEGSLSSATKKGEEPNKAGELSQKEKGDLPKAVPDRNHETADSSGGIPVAEVRGIEKKTQKEPAEVKTQPQEPKHSRATQGGSNSQSAEDAEREKLLEELLRQ